MAAVGRSLNWMRPSSTLIGPIRGLGRLSVPVPGPPAALAKVQCVYEELPGWTAEIDAAGDYDQLPTEAQHYVSRVEALLGLPVGIISVGPEREQTILHHTQLEKPR